MANASVAGRQRASRHADWTTTAVEWEKPERTEVIRTRYPNRKIKIERHVVQDAERNYINHGLWTMWNVDGAVVAKGQFLWGKRQGRWYRLHIDDNKNGVAGKLARYFAPPFASEADFAGDEVHGTWRIFDVHNREMQRYEFDHGRLHGVAVQRYPNGQKQLETHYVNGAITGVKEWDTNGREVHSLSITDGRTTIPYEKKYATGEPKIVGQYLSAKRIYKTKIDFWHGVVKAEVVRREGMEKRHGKWIRYYEDGAVQFKGEFVSDRPAGRHTWWYRNGKKRVDGEFCHGKKEGLWVWWHPNGQQLLKGKYAAGVPVRTWMRLSRDGEIEKVRDLDSWGGTSANRGIFCVRKLNLRDDLDRGQSDAPRFTR